MQTWTGHCAMAQAPPFDEHRRPFEKNENKKFPKLGLLNYPKRICNNPNPNPAMLQFIVYLIISPCMLQWNNLVQ